VTERAMPGDAREESTGIDLMEILGVSGASLSGHPDVVVAILDGPVDRTHPCLQGAYLQELPTLVSHGQTDSTRSRHGTHVASLLFSQPGSPLRGLAPGVTGLVLPIFAERSDGALVPCSQVDLARAIDQAVEEGAHIINISAGELTEQGEVSDILRHSIRQATERNRLVVAAVGNDGCECLHMPAALPEVLAVGAIDSEGRLVPFSNWSPDLSSHGIMAPGIGIPGAAPGGGIERLNGTSFAAPLVSGAAALLLSRQLQAGRPIDPGAVREVLLASAVPCDSDSSKDCERLLGGRLDFPSAWRALEERLAVDIETPDRLIPAGAGPTFNIHQRKVNAMMSGETQGIHPQESEQVSPQEIAAASAADGAGAVTASEAVVPATAVLSRPAAAPPATEAVRRAVRASAVHPSCGCDEEGFSQDRLVFALGTLYYDFGTEARRDYFVAQMGPKDPWKVYNPADMTQYLGFAPPSAQRQTPYYRSLLTTKSEESSHPEDANALIWTLNTDQIPMYAIRPEDQYAFVSYLQLVQFLHEQEFEGVERIAIAGTVRGTIRLLNGTVVPIISPVTRGMFSWSTEALVQAVDASRPANQKMSDVERDDLENFLQRIYYELRNLGVTAPDRAKNFAATNSYQAGQVFKEVYPLGLKLDKITVERSPICRPDSDCWDVSLLFFDPNNVFSKARQIYRYTIDVSDVVPVQVGEVRNWQVYSDPLAGNQ
jgi:cyanobactin maturation PatA/PatG family protease